MAEKSSEAGHTEERHMIPVWFFVGVLLLIYGILILIQGISEWSSPPNTALSPSDPFYATLASLHPTFWWSFILIILGGIFCAKHRPGKQG